MLRAELNSNRNERGVALITALLCTTLMLGLGLAAVMSTTVDTVTTKSHRLGEQSFFVADAGVGVTRRALVAALQEKVDAIRATGTSAYYKDQPAAKTGDFPDVQVLPPLDQNSAFYSDLYATTRTKASLSARDKRFSDINGARFTVNQVQLTSASISLTTPSSGTSTEVAVYRYWIQVTGSTQGGGSATVNETGQITTNIYLRDDSVPSAGNRAFSFSGFGAFFDNGDSNANSFLAAGTFTGPVHTNTHFSFSTSRNVTFRNLVSQVDDYIRVDSTNFNQGHKAIPTKDQTGIDISSEGYKQTSAVPLPENNFSQEYAVINSTGITDLGTDGKPIDPPAAYAKDSKGDDKAVFDASGRVTAETLAANLRNASNAQPTISAGKLSNGVYVPSSDGSSITGAGIYIKGNADDIKLYTQNGDQYYVVKQGSTTTTITVSTKNNTTTIASGSKTKTFTGVPTDRSERTDKMDTSHDQPGASLFVDGNINSLRGGYDENTGSTFAALASDTRLTITAQGDISVTGDIKYASPVANSDGSPVSNINSVKNVLGIFTNDGNVNLAPNSKYLAGNGLSMEINAAIVAFNSNKSNDGGAIEGSITYTGSSSPGSSDKWKLVGSRVQASINNIGYSNRDIFFDTRFSGGKFRPPFFPGTNYTLSEPAPSPTPVVTITSADSPYPVGMSWFRENN
jgi:hypothetical protein